MFKNLQEQLFQCLKLTVTIVLYTSANCESKSGDDPKYEISIMKTLNHT